MLGTLLLLFILVPVAEIIVIFKVAGHLGWLETLSILLLVSIFGAWLVRREGINTLVRIQGDLARGVVPTKQIVDGLLILVAGALLLTPGFLTDIAGLLLLFPPTRIAVRSLLIRRYRTRIDAYQRGATPGPRMWTHFVVDDDIVDTQGRERRPDRDLPEIE